MSINIPAETPDESTNPISVEEFERLHPAMLGAIRKAVREEPARTVIGTVGDDRRSHLSSLDLRGIGIEVGRQLSARDMTTEVMGSILEHINQAADRLSTEIQELRAELIREHVETVGGGCHGSIHRIESLGEEGKPLAQGSHPLVGIGRFSGLPEHGARLREIGYHCSYSHLPSLRGSAHSPTRQEGPQMRVLRKSKRRSPKSESKGESEMRKMKRSDVREWIPGEPLERVDFGNGCTGMNKSLPKEPGNAGDFKRLIWKCRAIEADGGPCLDVLPSEYWIDDVKQGDYFDVVTDESSYGPCSFGDAWFYLAGVDAGWHLARMERHSGLCATLRGIFDSLTHRHENATDAEQLVTASKPSRESAEHSSSCGSTPPSLSRSEIHESYDCATCGTTATQPRNHREAAAPHSRR